MGDRTLEEMIRDVRRGEVTQVTLSGDVFTSPYAGKPCVWFEWVHGARSPLSPGAGFSSGPGTGRGDRVTVSCSRGDAAVYPARILLHLEPSFHGPAHVDGQERYVVEYCLEPDTTYYAFAERFTFSLPPFRLLPFLPRRRSTWFLALSDRPLDGGRPVNPLILCRRGLTG
jgi:hypothetical protein